MTDTKKAQALFDTRMLIWVVTMGCLAGGGCGTMDSRGQRVTKLEDKQDQVSNDLRAMMANQAAICQATGATCER